MGSRNSSFFQSAIMGDLQKTLGEKADQRETRTIVNFTLPRRKQLISMNS